MNTKITSVQGFQIWDSRGRPTIEVEVGLESGAIGRGFAPAGASCGKNEAVDLRDVSVDKFGGLGVNLAINNVNQLISKLLIGEDGEDQKHIDNLLIDLDGTPNKAKLGGNAMIATSMAVLKAVAKSKGLPVWRYLCAENKASMPLPEIQIFGGGAHAGRRVDIQDFLVMPVAAKSFAEALSICADIYRVAGDLMVKKNGYQGIADEGGWWPNFSSNEEALSMLTQSIDKAGYGQGEALISLDIAASEFYDNGQYHLGLEGKVYDTNGWLEILSNWINRYPIISVEDPVDESDDLGMRIFTESFGKKIQIIGDDYLVTNAQLVDQAIKSNCCNAVLIKPNQAGTISETFEALKRAKDANWGAVISARSGETEDTLITHLAVGWNAGQLKVGSFARSERMAKWNEGLRIERQGALPYFGDIALANYFNTKSTSSVN